MPRSLVPPSTSSAPLLGWSSWLDSLELSAIHGRSWKSIVAGNSASFFSIPWNIGWKIGILDYWNIGILEWIFQFAVKYIKIFHQATGMLECYGIKPVFFGPVALWSVILLGFVDQVVDLLPILGDGHQSIFLGISKKPLIGDFRPMGRMTRSHSSLTIAHTLHGWFCVYLHLSKPLGSIRFFTAGGDFLWVVSNYQLPFGYD